MRLKNNYDDEYSDTQNTSMAGRLLMKIWREWKMSDDLISRKALINILKGVDKDGLLTINQIIDFIEDQPTAFDKEKVINEIHISSAGMAVNMNVSSSYAEGYIDAAKDIIEIVEKGGIE